jgi:glyoxylase-like metal-dependent hydrolase (beta-lactamase superfamily II)
MNRFKTFTGGPFDTNCFYYRAPGGGILFDAPQGSDSAFAGERVDLLVLTHGHFDHIADGAAIIKRHECRTAMHRDTAPMVNDREFFRRWGFELEIDTFTADILLEENPAAILLDLPVGIYHVPGHCPGSICFHIAKDSALVGGDVLFREGIGRWDLPGGDRDLLLEGIRQKLLPLPDATIVLPGHGPSTTIGWEKQNNPFLAD